ncbi:MAG: ATP-binding cassette domain-containing protein [Lachnospiraceae bacterium]|nr:ATP-binding cassette domain-containing protein [Lachnospiraceae bacterium]
MKAVSVDKLTFTYSGDKTPALKNVSFDVGMGEIMLVIGESGCGKTTLLRHLKPSHTPVGSRNADSSIYINGRSVEDLSEEELSFTVGFVGQQVDEAQVTDKVWHEIAFGLESMGCEQSYMQQKVAEMVAFFGLESVYHKKLSELSGGQKQLVNLCAVMIMEPQILVLDEPTSQLDPNSAMEFFHMIRKIHEELGTTIIISEHRLEDILPMADKVLVLDKGRVIKESTPGDICRYLYEKGLPLFRSMPAAARIYCSLETSGSGMPLSVNEGRSFIAELFDDDGGSYSVGFNNKKGIEGADEVYGKQRIENLSSRVDEKRSKESFSDRADSKQSRERLSSNGDGKQRAEKPDSRGNKKNAVVKIDEAWFRYDKDGEDVLKACSIDVPRGSITAILGGNGAGKSTLLHVIMGNIQPYLGKVKITDECTIGLLPQNPQAMFAEKTVGDELNPGRYSEEIRKLKGRADCSGENIEDYRLDNVIRYFGLSHCLYRHPFDLSGGEMEKLALAKMVLMDYDIFLLDEPGKGMDYAFKEKLGAYLTDLAGKGKTILLVSHDIEFCAKYADYCGMFFDGHIVALNNTRTFFLQNSFYTTSVRRMCRGMLDALTVEDVLALFGVNADAEKDKGSGEDEGYEGEEAGDTAGTRNKQGITGENGICEDDSMTGKVDEQGTEGKAETCEEREGVNKTGAVDGQGVLVETETCEDDEDGDKTGAKEEESKHDISEALLQKHAEEYAESKGIADRRKENIKKHISAVLPFIVFLVVMPVTIYIGYGVLHQRKYYFISVLLILEAVGTMLIGFEGSRPKLKEIMTIAVMSAITALSRAMFYMTPAVKPMAALTIISGIGLGGIQGFVVGALSMLVSDIFFSQGPWTPWQMFAMGLLGFLAGMIFNRENRKRAWEDRESKETIKEEPDVKNENRLLVICIYGALSVLIIYGGIMNPASVLMYQENVTWEMLIASYVPGFPIDCIHAASTFIFLWLLAEPMLEKLERVRRK